MTDGGPARLPGKPEKRALSRSRSRTVHKGRGSLEAAKKQQETPQANKNVADSYVESLEERKDKIKWRQYVVFRRSGKLFSWCCH